MLGPLRYRFDRRRHPQRYAHLGELLQVARLSAADLRDLQRRRFDSIVRHALANTRFYPRHYADTQLAVDRDIEPRSLPVLHKRDVREHLEDLCAPDAADGPIRRGHTGGSTGVPLTFCYDDAKHERMLAGMKRGFMMSGWRPGQRVLYLWGASRDVSGDGVFLRHGTHWLDSELSLAAVEYSEARLAAWLDRIRRWRPVLLYGYASALAELARFIVDTRQPPPRSLTGVYSTAEVLTDAQRALMTRAFGCRVYNQYGCREVPNIAWECRSGGLHVFSDLVLLEAVGGDDGERLLVTSLSDRLMPFIRYELGDSGRLLDGDCDCGSPFPLMETTLCRHNDLLTATDGRRIHPSVLNGLLYGCHEVRRYQWVQTAQDRLRLDLVSNVDLSRDRLQRMENGVRELLGDPTRLEVRYVKDIARSPAGKHRFVIGMSS